MARIKGFLISGAVALLGFMATFAALMGAERAWASISDCEARCPCVISCPTGGCCLRLCFDMDSENSQQVDQMQDSMDEIAGAMEDWEQEWASGIIQDELHNHPAERDARGEEREANRGERVKAFRNHVLLSDTPPIEARVERLERAAGNPEAALVPPDMGTESLAAHKGDYQAHAELHADTILMADPIMQPQTGDDEGLRDLLDVQRVRYYDALLHAREAMLAYADAAPDVRAYRRHAEGVTACCVDQMEMGQIERERLALKAQRILLQLDKMDSRYRQEALLAHMLAVAEEQLAEQAMDVLEPGIFD